MTRGRHRTLGELAVAWSQTGPTGGTGASGISGASGASGTAGVTRFFASDPASTADHTVATIGPLRLAAGCSAGGVPDLRGAVNEENNTMWVVTGHTEFGNTETAANELVPLTSGEVEFGGMGTAHFVTYATHEDIQVDWYVRNTDSLGAGTGCFYSGYVTNL